MGLDPVQNLSRSGLKPDYDDLGSKIKSNQNRIKSEPNQKQKHHRILVESLGNPGRNPNRIGKPRKSPKSRKSIKLQDFRSSWTPSLSAPLAPATGGAEDAVPSLQGPEAARPRELGATKS